MTKQKYLYAEDFFSRNTPETFYWAGFIAADGCIVEGKGRNKRLELGSAIKDLNHIRKFRKAIEYSGKIYKYTHFSKGYKKSHEACKLIITITKSNVCNDLENFNIVPRKSLIYTFPNWLKQHPLVNHFIRGYFDGDGTARKNGSKLIVGFVGTEKFLKDCQEIIMKNCNIKTYRSIKKYSGIWRLEFSGTPIALSVSKFLYKNSKKSIYLERKFNIIETERKNIKYNKSEIKPIIATSLDKKIVLKFDSMIDAATTIGIHRSGIWKCLTKQQKTCCGFYWKLDIKRKKELAYK